MNNRSSIVVNRLRLVRNAVFSLSIGLAFFIGPAGLAAEDWYSVELGGQKAGYMFQNTERVKREGQVLFRTLTETRIVLNRLGSRVEMLSSAEFIETENGLLMEVGSELKYSAQPVKTEARIEKDQVVVRTSSGGSSQERKVPFSGELLGPEGIRQASERALRVPGDSVVFQSFLPELSQLVLVTQTLAAVEHLSGTDRTQEALRVEESYSAYPQKRTLWLDRQGRTLRSSDPSPFGELVIRLTTKEDALNLSAAGALSDERFRDTLIKSNIRLPQARLIESVTLRLEKKSAAGPDWPAFEGPGQTVLEKAGESLTLRVERPGGFSGGRGTDQPALPDQDSRLLKELLQSNQYLNTDDGVLRKTASDILAGEGGSLRGALLLRDWVSGHMQFDLGLAFAPSSEIIRNLRGTCAEYAILLAAMLRTAGIPSRFLMGYVYLNGIWGGHAWVEAFIDGLWLPLDAAVISPGIADAARFSVSRSSLNEGLGELLGGGASLFGNLKVSVLSYALKGKRVEVDPRAPLSVVMADWYVNAGLGLRLRKPAGFAFAELDGTWPDRMLLSLKGPRGEIIQVFQDQWRPAKEPEVAAFRLLESLVPQGVRSHIKVLGKNCPLVKTEKKAAAAILNGVDVWLIQSEGGRALDQLKTVLSSFAVSPLWPAPDCREAPPAVR
jgi:hypothetical protein